MNAKAANERECRVLVAAAVRRLPGALIMMIASPITWLDSPSGTGVFAFIGGLGVHLR